jgi:hypothetical protein
MILPLVSRRSLLGTAIKGAGAWLSSHLFFLTAQANYSMAAHTELITLCSDLRCSWRIGEACRLALSPSQTWPSSLVQAILADIESPGHPAPNELAHALMKRSRADFRERRVVSVDGWILSLTETRLYALAGLLSEAAVPAA